MAQVVAHLPSRHKVLSTNPNYHSPQQKIKEKNIHFWSLRSLTSQFWVSHKLIRLSHSDNFCSWPCSQTLNARVSECRPWSWPGDSRGLLLGPGALSGCEAFPLRLASWRHIYPQVCVYLNTSSHLVLSSPALFIQTCTNLGSGLSSCSVPSAFREWAHTVLHFLGRGKRRQGTCLGVT
jgi:hypothetical protein